jgi:hypothetical protein
MISKTDENEQVRAKSLNCAVTSCTLFRGAVLTWKI